MNRRTFILSGLAFATMAKAKNLPSFWVRIKEAEFSDPTTVSKLRDIFYDATEYMKKPKNWVSMSLEAKKDWAYGKWVHGIIDEDLGLCREWRCSESQLKDNVNVNKMNSYKGQLNPLVGNKDYTMGISE